MARAASAGGMKSVKGKPSREAPGRSRRSTAANSELCEVNFKSSPENGLGSCYMGLREEKRDVFSESNF